MDYKVNKVLCKYLRILEGFCNYFVLVVVVLLFFIVVDGYGCVEILICGGVKFEVFFNIGKGIFDEVLFFCVWMVFIDVVVKWRLVYMLILCIMGDMLIFFIVEVLIINGVRKGIVGW